MKDESMNRSEIINKLRGFKADYKERYGFKRIGIFGSVARDMAKKNSDIDIIVEQNKPDLFILGCIKTDLEEKFGRKVDIVRLRENMNLYLKKRIDKEALYV